MRHIVRLLFLFGILLAAACSNSETKTLDEVRKVPVEVIRVRKQPKEEVLNLLGTVEPSREMKVAFKIGGRIRRLAFKEGELIEKEQLLAQLDPTELLARKEKALANKSKAKRDLNRMESLFQKHIVPLSSYQDAQSLFVIAEAELKIVEDSLASTIIRAPFTGRITKKLSEVGEIIALGAPVAILAEIDPILVKAAVPDNLIHKIRRGQTAYVHVDSYPKDRFKGIISRLETTADPLSRTFRMEVRLANPGEKLRLGLIAQVRLIYKKEDPSIFIPLDAIVEFGSNASVFVIKNLKAERRMIRSGDVKVDRVEVLEGLVPDELVVVSGLEYLKEQQPVLIDQKVPENR